VPTGNYGEVLLEVADQLCAELAFVQREEVPGARSALNERGALGQTLSPQDRSLVMGVREGLARIVAAASAGAAKHPDMNAVQIALDGAESVVRGELVSGNEDRLPRLMPSFVFLVALPAVGQDRALALSRRASELIEQALRKRI